MRGNQIDQLEKKMRLNELNYKKRIIEVIIFLKRYVWLRASWVGEVMRINSIQIYCVNMNSWRTKWGMSNAVQLSCRMNLWRISKSRVTMNWSNTWIKAYKINSLNTRIKFSNKLIKSILWISRFEISRIRFSSISNRSSNRWKIKEIHCNHRTLLPKTLDRVRIHWRKGLFLLLDRRILHHSTALLWKGLNLRRITVFLKIPRMMIH